MKDSHKILYNQFQMAQQAVAKGASRSEQPKAPGTPKGKAGQKQAARAELLQREYQQNERHTILDVDQSMRESENHLRNTENVLANTLVSGATTTLTLRQQRDQLQKAAGDVAEMDSVLVSTRNVLNRMKRRIIANKFIQLIMVVVELGIAGVIVYFKYYA